MSFYIHFTAESKQEAIKKFEAEFSQVVTAQVEHNHDEKQVRSAVEAYLGLIRDPKENENVVMVVNGSVGWETVEDDKQNFVNVSIGVQAYLTLK